MHSALSIQPAGHGDSNVALFIPRSMRGRRRRRDEQQARERRDDGGTQPGRRTRRKSGRDWTCTILHSIPWHFCVVVLDAFSFFALTLRFLSFLSSFFLRTRLFQPLFPPCRSLRWRRIRFDDEFRREPGLSRCLELASVRKRERDTERFVVKRLTCAAVSVSDRRMRTFALRDLAIPNEPRRRVPFAPSLRPGADNIALCRSNDIRGSPEPSTLGSRGDPIISDIGCGMSGMRFPPIALGVGRVPPRPSVVADRRKGWHSPLNRDDFVT